MKKNQITDKQEIGNQLAIIYTDYKSVKPLIMPDGRTIGRYLLDKYPDKIPIVIDNRNILMDKTKFVMPGDATMGYVMLNIRKHSKLLPSETIFAFINNQLPRGTDILSSLYTKNKNVEDDCLYITITRENTFGSRIENLLCDASYI
jgi:hypothetical protein